MKKIAKVLSVLIIATMVIMAFTACSKKDKDKDDTKTEGSKVIGKTYTFDKATSGSGEDVSATLLALYKEQSFTFKEGGVCVQTVVWSDAMAATFGTDPAEVNGTYEEKGDTVKVTFEVDGEKTTMELKIDGDTLKISEEDGSEVVYKKK